MPGNVPVTTRQFSDYTPWPDLTEAAVQDAIPTESYGNFGLAFGTYTRRTGTGCQEEIVRCTRTAISALALEDSATCPSIPGSCAQYCAA